jgi:uncharacterized repeat protein (TIGR03803 family)
MRDKRFSDGLRAALTILIPTLLVASSWAAPHEKVLYSFKDNDLDGKHPQAGLVFNASGNLYGTTAFGGCSDPYGCGTVFELIPTASGRWEEKVLHRFDEGDGFIPLAGLIFDATGNLYGTTDTGGGGSNIGTVFELTPTTGGRWEEKVLHGFDLVTDGYHPVAGLVFDASGNLYGTTYEGPDRSSGLGTVFELTPKAGGSWTEKILHTFTNQGKDGCQPESGLISDGLGNLYGTTATGGGIYSECRFGCGTVFEVSPKAGGSWTEKVLYSFNPTRQDGYQPYATLIFDASGNLYGTTQYGGSGSCDDGQGVGCGVVFELTPKTGGGWAEKILHNFNGKDGAYPVAGLIFDASGNLYGTTTSGGGTSSECKFGCGTVFELTPKASGNWTEKVLHSFNPNGKGGAFPEAGLIFDTAGNLYGTTYGGGAYGYGTVFEILP